MATVSLSACHHLKLCFQLTPSLMSFKLLQNTNKQTAPVAFVDHHQNQNMFYCKILYKLEFLLYSSDHIQSPCCAINTPAGFPT